MKVKELCEMFSTENDIIIAAKDGKVLYKGSIDNSKQEYGDMPISEIKFDKYQDYTPKIIILLDIPTSDWLCPRYPVLMEGMARGRYSTGDIASLLDLAPEVAIAKIECRLPFTLEEAKKIRHEYYPLSDMDYVFSLKYTVIPAV